MTEGSTADKGPANPNVRLQDFPEAVGKKNLGAVLRPIEDELLTAEELNGLFEWLKANPASSLAQDIVENNLFVFGKPVGGRAPCVRWGGGVFRRVSGQLGNDWLDCDRVARRG